MPDKKTGGGFYGWWLLPILCLVYSIPIGFALYGPPVINTYMTKALGWERGQINLGYTIMGIMLGMGALFIPFLINRFGPRKTLVIGYLTAVSSCGLSAGRLPISLVMLLRRLGLFRVCIAVQTQCTGSTPTGRWPWDWCSGAAPSAASSTRR
jgi:Na+/melibiose symporter-like transporter